MENKNINEGKSCRCDETVNRDIVSNLLTGPDGNEFTSEVNHALIASFSGSDNNNRNEGYLNYNYTPPYTESMSAFASGYYDWPVVKNNTLAFRDEAHIDSYQQYLEKAIVVPPNSNRSEMSQGPDDILEAIENKIGFTSLRNVTEKSFRRLSEIGWDRLEDIPVKHFIHDIITKSILNPNLEVEVGDKKLSVLKYPSKSGEQSYNMAFVTQTDTSKLIRGSLSHDFEETTSYPGQFDPNPIPTSFEGPISRDFDGTTSTPGQFDPNPAPSWFGGPLSHDFDQPTSTPGQFDPTPPPRGGGVKGIRISGSAKVTARADYVREIDSPTAPDCNGNYKKITLPNVALFDKVTNSYVVGAKFIIDWGDGTVVTEIGTVGSGNSYSHTYAHDGTYNIVVKFYTPTGDPIGISNVPIEVPIQCSTFEGWRIQTWGHRPAGNRAIRCSSGCYRPWGASRQRVFAVTEAFHWDNARGWGEWKWRPYDGAIRLLAEYTIFWGKTEKNPYRCAPDGTDSASTMPWWAKEAIVRQTGDLRGWRYLKSAHEMHNTDGKGDIRVELFVKPCDSVGGHPREVSGI